MIIIQNIKDSNHILYINNQSKFYYKEGNERDRNLNTFDKILNNYSSDDFITYRGEFWTYINFNQENPIQGWKIHISATIENYLTVFDLVTNYCINNKIDFKYVKDVRSLRLSQDKSYSRESSGKFIVIYPKYNIIHNVLSDLYDILRGFKGQYILSDKRFKDSQCIYYRYGEILPIYQLNDRGIKETFILNDKNELCKDKRLPYFYLPSWVEELIDESENYEKKSILLSKYKITSAINFSATGGIYVGENNGVEYIIKESRAFTGLDGVNQYSIDRLINEKNILQDIEDIGTSPRVIEYIEDWENSYLVIEKIKGNTFNDYIFRNNPLIKGNISNSKSENYYKSIEIIYLNYLKSIREIHRQNIVLLDVSPHNIIITDENLNIKIIDLECATYLKSPKVTGIETPGFRNYFETKNDLVQEDIYKIGNILLYSLVPMNAILELDINKYKDILMYLRGQSFVPENLISAVENIFENRTNNIDEIINDITIDKESVIFNGSKTVVDLKLNVQESLNNILNTIEYQEDKFIFPADPHLLNTNSLSIAHGITGILYSIYICKSYLSNDTLLKNHIDKLSLLNIEKNNLNSSLFMGLSGISWVYFKLGYFNEGKELLKEGNRNLPESSNLFYGKAGVALTNLYFYKVTSDVQYLNNSKYIEKDIYSSAVREKDKLYWREKNNTFYGYGQGGSGISLFYLYLYLETNNGNYLNKGEKALEYDLSNLIIDEDGNLGLNREGENSNKEVLSPYLYDGLAGLGSVVIRYYKVTKDKKYLDIVEAITKSLDINFTIFPSYMRGLSGIIHYHLDVYQFRKSENSRRIAKKLIDNLFLYEDKEYPGLYAGEQLFRLSNDFSTGSPGITTAIVRYLDSLSGIGMNNNFYLDEFYLEMMDEI